MQKFSKIILSKSSFSKSKSGTKIGYKESTLESGTAERDKEIDKEKEKEKEKEKINEKEGEILNINWVHKNYINTLSMKRDSFAIRTKHNLELKRKTMMPLKQLMDVIRFGGGNEFKEMMEHHKNINIDAFDLNGNTLLMIACEEGNSEVVSVLINLGASLNYQNFHGETALHFAAKKRNLEIIDLLTQAGANDRITDNKGKTIWDLELNF